MKHLILLAIAFIAIQLQACNSNSGTNDSASNNDSSYVDTTHNAQNALDWAGIYDGILPCADCSGIKTSIKLNEDNTFSYTAKYLEKDTAIQDSGKFMWHDNGSTVHLIGKDINNMYKVGEDMLIQLDETGSVIEGPISEKYYLVKTQ